MCNRLVTQQFLFQSFFKIVDVLYFLNLPIELVPYTTTVLCKTFLSKFGIGVSWKNCTVGRSSIVAMCMIKIFRGGRGGGWGGGKQ